MVSHVNVGCWGIQFEPGGRSMQRKKVEVEREFILNNEIPSSNKKINK